MFFSTIPFLAPTRALFKMLICAFRKTRVLSQSPLSIASNVLIFYHRGFFTNQVVY